MAGKRRIANGIQQQFGVNSLLGISGKLNDDENGNNGFGRITPTTTAITTIALAACVLIISVFAIVVAVLQVCYILSFEKIYLIQHIFSVVVAVSSILYVFSPPATKRIASLTLMLFYYDRFIIILMIRRPVDMY